MFWHGFCGYIIWAVILPSVLNFYFMAFYKLVKYMSNPVESFGDQKWYARPFMLGELGTEDLARVVANRSGHSQGQLVGLFQDYFNQIFEHVCAGEHVSMFPLGTVIAHFRGSGSETEEGYDPSLVSQVHLSLRPGVVIRKRIQTTYHGGELELTEFKLSSLVSGDSSSEGVSDGE